MNVQNEKCVVILDERLPAGIAANTAAILGLTLGKHRPEAIGSDVTDRSGKVHLGIIEVPVPVLRGSPEKLRELRERLYQTEYQELTTVDFSDLAQGCKTYDEFIGKMEETPEGELRYLGLAICGPKKQVDRLTGSLPLLR